VNQDRENSGSNRQDASLENPKKNKGKQMSDVADSSGAIGAGLRSLYQDIVSEPLPDDILALLSQLESFDSDDK
jgi:Anti-sigma factor NepR